MICAKPMRVTCVLLVGTISAAARGGEPVEATFRGTQSDQWNNALNWSINQVPNNNGTTEYSVFLTRDCSFFAYCSTPRIVSSPGLIALTGLHIGEYVDFTVEDGLFRPGATEFEYLSEMIAFGGDIEFTRPEGNYANMNIKARDGSRISGVLTEIPNCQTILMTGDNGGLIDFPQLQSISGTLTDASFSASASGGTVDVSALTDLRVESQWYAIDGGIILAGAFANDPASPIRNITVQTDSVVSLPGVTRLDGAVLRINDNGVIATPPIVSFDNGTVILEEGASYSMDITHYFGDLESGLQIRSRDSDLAFPNLKTIEIADGINLAVTVSSGSMDLPVLTEFLGPGGRLTLTFGRPGDLNVPLLTRVEPRVLLSFSTGSHTVPPIDFREISSLNAGGVSTVHFSGVLNLTGTNVNLSSFSTLTANQISSIDDASFELRDAATLALPIDSCLITDVGLRWLVHTPDTHLDMSALKSLVVDGYDENSRNFKITVRDGGRISLGSPLIDTAPGDWVLFEVNGPESTIEIGPNAVIAGSSYWKITGNGEMRVPATVPIAPISGVELNGGVLHLPGLTTFDEAFLGVYAPTDFVTNATDTELHNTSVHVNRTNWTLDATTWSWDRPGNLPIFDGFRGSLFAPDLNEMTLSPPPGMAPATLTFKVRDGTLDFSSVATLTGPPSESMHVLLIETSNNNGIIDFSGLESATGDIKIRAYRYGSLIDWGTNLRNDSAFDDLSGSSFRIWTEGTLLCRGSVFITSSVLGDRPYLGTGTFIMAAPGSATLEIYHLDEGTAVEFPSSIARLVIGDEESPTRVLLVDDFNNGARGPADEPEALYIGLYGDEEFLRIGPGASLVLNGLNVYLRSDQGIVHLNTLWPANQRAFPYDQGMLYRVDPALCPADFSAPFDQLDFFDALAFLTLFGENDPEADMDANGLWDFFDVQAFLSSYAAGCE